MVAAAATKKKIDRSIRRWRHYLHNAV